MDGTLNGKHVVITGAGGGLGGAVVEAIRSAGATCHTPSRADLELTSESAVASFYAALPSLWASIHIAGGFAMAPIAQTSLEAFEAQWRVNAVTAFLCSREAVKKIRTSGKTGRIVNVASRVALEHPGGKIAYVTAKSAVAGMTEALAAETRSEGILVNAVLPDTIDTPANRAAMPKADFSKWTPPSAIAKSILWLASPENESVTGTLVPV